MLITAPRVIPATGGAGIPASGGASAAGGAGSPAPGTASATSGAGILAPGYVSVEAGLITEVGAGRPPRAPDLVLDTGILIPGMIDLQLNGSYGVDLAAVDAEGWALLARRLPETGTTGFLATFISAPVAELAGALGSARELVASGLLSGAGGPGGGPAAGDHRVPGARVPGVPGAHVPGVSGARVLGVHMEGPFLAPARAGAHRREWLIPPTAEAVGELLAAGAGVLRLVTMAPELAGGLAAVTQLAAAGLVVSIGHSDATAEQVAAAAEAGARMVTHLFNAQRPFHHREPGVAGRALTDHRLTCGLIADSSHVSPAAIGLAFAAAPGRICLVTDAVAAAGMPPGRYLLGGQTIEVAAAELAAAEADVVLAAPRLADGTLAGSVLRMDQAVANTVAAGVSLPAAVAAATRVPADLIGRPDVGRLAPSAAADLTWLDDDLRARATWVAGELVYSRA
ncbi:MAG TPA: amidohydrolase family protein [Streptosporangiaceae bacterium]